MYTFLCESFIKNIVVVQNEGYPMSIHNIGFLRHKKSSNLDIVYQGSHRLEKYLNLEGFLEKSLKIKFTLKSTGKSLKGIEKSLNSSIFCRT